MEQLQPAGLEFADKNLLFGIVALQTEFIDQRQFIDVCGAWAARKDARLGDLLLERRWINHDDRQQIERLLDRKLHRAGGDAQGSLRGIQGQPARLALAEASLKFPFIKDVVAAAGLEDFEPDLPLDADSDEDPRQRYEFLEFEPRKGGIGQVWRVRDKALGRVLALKELNQDRRMDKHSRECFFREAQVNAQLTHPNIVPLFDFFRCPGRSPFYTMQFIEGRTLSDAADQYHMNRRQGKETPLALRDLLTSFVAVCQAVGYAHDQGVLHRDLKGKNVVVGNHGAVFLVDWGLAKVRDDREQALHMATTPAGMETRHGDRLGTPSYMAPEAAAGDPSRINERTDIYGLGAILYEILSSRPPFPLAVPEGSGVDIWKQKIDELCARIQKELPTPIRTLNPRVPPALEAICGKAMAQDPERRYASAEALALEVTNWLADEPVQALPEAWHVRCARWTMKNKQWAAMVATVLLAAIPIAALLTREFDRQQLELEQARTKEAYVLAAKQRDLALGTIRAVTIDVRDELQKRPALEKLRKQLLEKALAGLQQVARSADKAESIDHHTFWVHTEMARWQLTYGSLKDATAEFDKAHRVALLAAKSGNPEARRDLAHSLQNMGDLSFGAERWAEAMDYYEQSLRAVAELAAADKEDRAAQFDLSVAHHKMGEASLRLSPDAEAGERAEAHFAEHLSRARALADADQANLLYRRQLSVAYIDIGNLKLRSAEFPVYDEAMAFFEKALRIRKFLCEKDENDSAAQRDLWVAYQWMAEVSLKMDRESAARDYFARGLTLASALLDADRTSMPAKRDLADSYRRLGDVSMQFGKYDEAREFFHHGHLLVESMARQEPDNLQSQIELYAWEKKLGTAELAALDFPNAELWFGKALQTTHDLLAADRLKGHKFEVQARFVADECQEIRETVKLLEDPESIKKQPVEQRRGVLELLVRYSLKHGKTAAAQDAADRLAQLPLQDKHALFQAACACGAILKALPPQSPLQSKVAAQAIALLQRAADKGFVSIDLVRHHADMAALQNQPGLQMLIIKLETPPPQD